MAKGRKKKPEGERRAKRVVVRMTEAEYDALVAAATAAGVSLSEWMRRTDISQTNVSRPDLTGVPTIRCVRE